MEYYTVYSMYVQVYQAQKPDLSWCINFIRVRLGFYAEIQILFEPVQSKMHKYDAEFNLNTFITSGSTQNSCNLYFFCQLYHHRSQMSVIGQESFLYRLQILIRSDPDLFCRIQSQTKRTEYYPYRNWLKNNKKTTAICAHNTQTKEKKIYIEQKRWLNPAI